MRSSSRPTSRLHDPMVAQALLLVHVLLTLKWYSPDASLLIVTGSRLLTTISLCSFPPFALKFGCVVSIGGGSECEAGEGT